jgi:hypothetical protein
MLLGLQHFGGKGACWSLGMGTRKSDKHQLLTQTYTNQTTSWLVHILNIFDAWTNHGQTRTHRTHHNPNLGEATTFPLIVYFVPGHGTSTQMSFCLEIPKIRILAFLDAHNFVCRPLIEVRSKAKL